MVSSAWLASEAARSGRAPAATSWPRVEPTTEASSGQPLHIGEINRVLKPERGDGLLQQFPDLGCGHRAKPELKRICWADSRVAGRHQADGVRAAEQKRGEISGRPTLSITISTLRSARTRAR